MLRLWRGAGAIALASLVVPLPAAARPTSPKAQMKVVLSALQPTVQVTDRPYSGTTLAELMREKHVPAVSIALIENGRVAWAGAFGQADVASLRPATTRTLFQAASISKPVAATAALALVERGALDLDRPVNAQLVSWQIPDNDLTRARPVTLRQLLTHTAGLTVHGFPGYSRTAPMPTLAQILDGTPPANTGPVRVEKQPGSAWNYSGGGFTVAQLLMTDTMHQDFPDLLDQLVLRPAGMSHSMFGLPPSRRAAKAASGYNGTGVPVPGGYHLYPELAAAGLWTTPTDLARWALAISAAFNGKSHGPISPATARSMLTPGLGTWGLGVQVEGEGEWLRFSHGGANEGFRCQLAMYPRRGEGIVVMTNGDNGPAIFASIIQAVGRARGWPDSKPRMIAAAEVSRTSLEEVVGQYSNPAASVDVALAGDRLTLSIQGGAPDELLPKGNDVFLALENGVDVRFQRDPGTGRVTAVSGAGMTLSRVR